MGRGGDADLRLRIGADTRQWEKGLKRAQAKARTFGRRTSATMRNVGAKIGRALTSPFAGLIGGALVLKAAHDIAQFDSRLTRLAIQGNLTTQQQMDLRESIMQTGLAAGQSREEVLGGLDAIVERTGDIGFARDVMRDLAVASTATGASMGDLGALAANLRDKMGLANDEIKGALATLTSQGKQGAFTLQNMAAMGERLFSAAGRFDVQGMEGIKQFGALVQVARMGTGSSEQATTAIEGMLADIIDKQKQIRKHARGFDIFKPGTKGELKSIDQVIKGIVRGTGGDITKLQQIFGRESIRGISTLAKVYKDTGGFDLFDKIAAGGDPAVLMKDFARYSESAAFQMQQLKNMGTLFADSALSPIIADLSDRLREFTSDPARVEAFVSQIRALGSEIGNLATFLMQLADNPIVKTFILNPVRAVGAYAEWIDAAGNQAAREQTRAARTRAGYSMMPKHLKADIRKRLAAGERVNLEREVMQWQTRQQLKAQNTVNIRNEIHTDGRVYTTSDDLDTTVNSDTKRGSMILDQD